MKNKVSNTYVDTKSENQNSASPIGRKSSLHYNTCADPKNNHDK